MTQDGKVPFEVAGKTAYVSPDLRERLLSPEGWGALSIEELAEAGLGPGTSSPDDDPPRATFRPAGQG